MRGIAFPLAAVLLLLVASPSALPPGAPLSEPHSEAPVGVLQPVTEDLEAYPGPDSWVNESLPTVSLHILHPTFVPEFVTSWILLDGKRLIPNWDPIDRTVWAVPDEELADGSHQLAIDLRDAGQASIQANWSFKLDTLVPRVDLSPLPLVAEKRVIPVNGTYVEEHLEEIAVNGFSAVIDGNTFRVQVLLWPGRTEIHVVATDEAGNRGLGEAVVLWTPSPPANQSYEAFAHENGSFIVKFPSDWEVHADYEYEGGLVADTAAFGPSAERIQPSISVVSRPASRLMDETLLLGGMESAILTLRAQSKLEVISRPRLVDLDTGSLAAQFSVVQTLPEGPRAFVVVTGYWSRPLAQIWMMVGTLSTLEVETGWHALETAFETFQVVEPPPPPEEPGVTPEGIFQLPTYVTALAIGVIVTVFFLVLYRRRQARRRAEDE